ncbi:hypothetical protein N6H18_03000 [Reichenbachiella agarivorans]|uniref:CVNH domain-containing protein n=1 Tax=Reichenbachiella agarivorans TaxID=2979464 RepID=A0ABY6CQZ5_9BACT|nr:hypothetical protein [Reichenbachiella agarivorans]UXP32922.1 hypothetical protein N6H18_03000 [Reichenbachiella agarivorans]
MKHTTYLLLLALLFTTLWSGCEDPEGACETKISVGGSQYIYSCRNKSYDEGCNSGSASEAVFHEGKDCQSLGYQFQETTDAWFYSEDETRKPGANGAFKSDKNTRSGADCNGGYNGPEFDIQIDSQCQTAYIYTCSGAQEGVDAACAIYKAWQKENSSIPNCPYCN